MIKKINDIKFISKAKQNITETKYYRKSIKRSVPKIITSLVTMLAVKKKRIIQNLSPELMILPVRTLKRQMQKRQCSYLGSVWGRRLLVFNS